MDKKETQVENLETTDTDTQPDKKEGSDNNQQEESTKKFTQDEVNKLVAKEKRKIKEQYKDYDDLKNRNQELENQVAEVKDKVETVESKLKATNTKTSIDEAIKSFGTITDANLVKKLLNPENYKLSETGEVTNVNDLIQEVIKEHPTLVKKVAPDNTIPSNTEEKPKFNLFNHSQENPFFKGGGVKQVELPFTIGN